MTSKRELRKRIDQMDGEAKQAWYDSKWTRNFDANLADIEMARYHAIMDEVEVLESVYYED